LRLGDGERLNSLRSFVLASIGFCFLSAYLSFAAASIVDLFRAEFVTRNPLLVSVQVLEFKPISKKKTSNLVYIVRAIRADSEFNGKFEDEQFGVFVVNANRNRILKTLDVFNTPRWNDYELKIKSVTPFKIVVKGRGTTYGDQPLTKSYTLEK